MDFVDFQKEKAEHFIDCLKNGKPIEPQDPTGWTRRDMLTLAGVCRFAALSHGPMSYAKMLVEEPEELQARLTALHPEYREAVAQTWEDDLTAVVEFCSHLAGLVIDGKYDEQFEPRVMAMMKCEMDVAIKRNLKPLLGFKDQ